MWTPILLVFGVLEVAVLVQPLTGGQVNIVGLIIFTPVVTILAWHVSGLVRDLRSSPVTTEDTIRRKWSRFDLPFSRSYYIYVGGVVFRVPKEAWAQLLPGDRVSVIYLPHTATVEELALLPGETAEPGTPKR